jgi:hypothetical protein
MFFEESFFVSFDKIGYVLDFIKGVSALFCLTFFCPLVNPTDENQKANRRKPSGLLKFITV